MESDGPRPEHLLFLPVGKDDLGDGRLVIREEDDEDGVAVLGVDEAFHVLELLAFDVALLVMDESELADVAEKFLRGAELRKGCCRCHHQNERRQDEAEFLHGVSPYRFGLSSTSQECGAFECRGLR